MDNIKSQFKSSLVVKDDYFKGFINHLLDVFSFDKDAEKLAPNSWVGCMGSRHSSFIQSKFWKINDKDQLGLVYQKFKHPYLNKIVGDDYILTDEIDIKNLETNFYIHSQILDIEAMEAHKLYTLLKNISCVPLCVKTDAIVYIDESNICYWYIPIFL